MFHTWLVFFPNIMNLNIAIFLLTLPLGKYWKSCAYQWLYQFFTLFTQLSGLQSNHFLIPNFCPTNPAKPSSLRHLLWLEAEARSLLIPLPIFSFLFLGDLKNPLFLPFLSSTDHWYPALNPVSCSLGLRGGSQLGHRKSEIMKRLRFLFTWFMPKIQLKHSQPSSCSSTRVLEV